MLDGPLRSAVNNGELAKVRALLEHGANPNRLGRHGDSALHIAVRLGRHGIMEEILAHGGDVAVRNAGGETALTLAAIASSLPMVELILQHGAGVSGYSLAPALSWAIIHCNIQMAEAMIVAGADVNASRGGRSIFEIAKWWHDEAIPRLRPPRKELLDYLVHRGARPSGGAG